MAKRLSKSNLVDAVAKATGGTKADAERALNAIFDTISSALKKGNQVAISGFGTFEVRKRKARTARNPRTGETMKIPATKVAKFKPAKALREAVK